MFFLSVNLFLYLCFLFFPEQHLVTPLAHQRLINEETLEYRLDNPLTVPKGKVLDESCSVAVDAKDHTDLFEIYHLGYERHSHCFLLLYAVFQASLRSRLHYFIVSDQFTISRIKIFTYCIL